MPSFEFESRIAGIVAGIDEVGRGPLAGPVVAAAAIIDRARAPKSLLKLIDDSKRLTEARREKAFAAMAESGCVAYAVAEASVAEIDEINILQATFLAMRRALAPGTALAHTRRSHRPQTSRPCRPKRGSPRLALWHATLQCHHPTESPTQPHALHGSETL